MKQSLAHSSVPPAAANVRLPLLNQNATLGPRPSAGLLSRAWQWIRSRHLGRADAGRLQVAETVSLGEKRFVAVVQVDGRHFLLAGGPANIALLAQLDDKEPFANVLRKTMTVAEKHAVTRKSGKIAGQAAALRPAQTRRPKVQQTSQKQTAKLSSKALPSNPSAASKPLPAAAQATFAGVLSRAMTTAATPPARSAPRRATPAKPKPVNGTLDPWTQEKKPAAQTKAVTTAGGAAAAPVSAVPPPAPGVQNLEQWLQETVAREQFSKRPARQSATHSAPGAGTSAAASNESEASRQRREESSAAGDPTLALPPARRTSHASIEEYA